MKSSTTNYLFVGIFVLAMVAGVVVSVALLTGRTGATDGYYTVYGNVTGVKFGTQVLYEGYPVGQVERVTPFEDAGRMRFRVDFGVVEGWRIPADSVARIAASGLLAAVAISISAGTAEEALPPGSEVQGREAANIFAAVSSMAGTIGDLSQNSLKPLLDDMRRTVGLVGDILEGGASALVGDASTLVGDVNRMVGDISGRAPGIMSDLESFMQKINIAADDVNQLLVPENRKKLEGMISSIDRAANDFVRLSKDLNGTRRHFDDLIAALNGVIEENRPRIDQSMVDLRHVMESVARHIDSVNQNMEGAARNLYEFSRQIRQNPGLLLGARPPADKAATQ